MACKYTVPNFEEDSRRDEILEYLDTTPGTQRNANEVLKKLQDSKVVRIVPDRRGYPKVYIHNGSMYSGDEYSFQSTLLAKEQSADVLRGINSVVGEVFKLTPTKSWTLNTPLDFKTETYRVTVNKKALKDAPVGFGIDEESNVDPQSTDVGQYILPFESRRALGESAEMSELDLINDSFRRAFEAAGVEVTVEYNTDLLIPGRVIPTGPKQAIVQLNPNLATRETAIHEMSHIFIDLVGLDNPAVQEALEELRGSDIDTYVREMYPDLIGERYDKELLATYLGLAGESYDSAPKSKLQRIVNKIIRAIAKVLGLNVREAGKLIDRFMEREYASLENGVLAEEVQEQRRQRKSRSKSKSKTQDKTRRRRRSKVRQSFTETNPKHFAQDLIDQIQTRIVQLERKGGIVGNKSREIRGQEIELLKTLRAQLETLESAQEFSDFVLTASRRTSVMKANMTKLINSWPEIDQEMLTQEAYERNISRLVNILEEVNFYYNSDFTRSTLHTISRLVDNKVNDFESLSNFDEASRNPVYKELKKMQSRLKDTIADLQVLNEEVYYIGLNYQADWLLGFHDENLDPQVQEIIQKIQETRKWRNSNIGAGGILAGPLGLRTADPQVSELRSQYQRGEITKEELKDELTDLAIEHIKEKLPGRTTLVNMLKSAYRDKSAYSFWVDPHIYSSWVPAQLFQKGVQTHFTNATERTRADVFTISNAREEFIKAAGRTDFNPEKLNQDLIEEVTYYAVDPNTDKYVPIKIATFVQPFLVKKFNENQRKFYKELNEEFQRPKYDPSNPEEFTEWLQENGKAYSAKEKAWWKANTQASDTALQKFKSIAEEYNKLNKQVTRMQNTLKKKGYIKKQAYKKYTEYELEKLEQDVVAKTQLMDSLEKEIRGVVVLDRPAGSFLNHYNGGKVKESSIVFKREYAKPKEYIYSNPKYTKIQNNPALKSAYDTLLNMMKSKQSTLGYKNPMVRNAWDDFSYMLPTVRNSTKDRMIEQGAYKALKDAVKDGTTTQSTDTNYGVLVDTNGDPLKSIAMYFVNPVESKDVSKDIWESVALFSHMSNMHKGISKIADVATMQLTLMENMSIGKQSAGKSLINFRKKQRGEIEQTPMQGKDSFMYKATKEFVDSMILGQRDIKAQFQMFGRTLDAGKISSNIAKYTALNTLSFNLLQATNQFLLDNFQSFNEAVAGEYHTKEDWMWGKKTYWAAAGGITDISKFTNKTKLGQAMQMFDALTENTDHPGARGGNRAKKVMSTNNLMFIQKGVEHELQGVRMLAMMRRKKGFKTRNGETIYVEKGSRKLTTKNTGEEANLWDILTKNDKGYLRIDRMVGNFTNKDVAAFTLKLRGLSRMSNQIKGSMDRSRYQRRWWGPLIGLFRNWMPPGIRKRFGHMDGIHIDEELGRATEGTYISLARYLTDMITTEGALANVKEFWNSRTDMEKANIKRSGIELAFGVMMMALGTLLVGLADDDEEDSPLLSFTLYQVRRLQAEMFVYLSLGEAYRMVKSPTPTARPVGRVLELTSHMLSTEIPYAIGLPVDESNIFYQRSSGMFDKGDRKLTKKFIQAFPVGPGFLKSFNAQEAVEYFERSPFTM